MKRDELMDAIQEIQDRNYNKFKGSNEAELHTREEIADLFEAYFKTSASKLENITTDLKKELYRRENTLTETHAFIKVASKMEFEFEKKFLFQKRDALHDHVYDLKETVKKLEAIINPNFEAKQH